MNTRHLFTFSLMLNFAVTAVAQPLSEPVGGAAAGMGYCSNSTKNLWGIFNNQATLAYMQNLQVGAAMENRFLLEELNRISLGAAKRVGKGCLFAGVDHFGGQLYSEMKAGAGYALQLGSYVSAGLQIDMLRIFIGEGYGSHYAITFEGGLFVRPHEKISLGIHCFNPVHVKWMGTDEHVPVDLSAGIAYRPEKAITICVEIMKNSMHKACLSAGCEYRFRESFFIRAGIKSFPYALTFGAGIKFGRMMLDVASGLHAYLGFSPSISITYSAKK